MEKVRAFIVCMMSALLDAHSCRGRMHVEHTAIILASRHNTSTASTQTSENVTMTTTTNATNVTHGEPISAAQGQNFTITLRSNPSTGYQLGTAVRQCSTFAYGQCVCERSESAQSCRRARISGFYVSRPCERNDDDHIQ